MPVPVQPCVACRCVRFNFDNSQVLSSGADAKVILWDWRSRTAARIFSGHFISVGACDIAFQVDVLRLDLVKEIQQCRRHVAAVTQNCGRAVVYDERAWRQRHVLFS